MESSQLIRLLSPTLLIVKPHRKFCVSCRVIFLFIKKVFDSSTHQILPVLFTKISEVNIAYEF